MSTAGRADDVIYHGCGEQYGFCSGCKWAAIRGFAAGE